MFLGTEEYEVALLRKMPKLTKQIRCGCGTSESALLVTFEKIVIID
jgi:hypothetical protein